MFLLPRNAAERRYAKLIKIIFPSLHDPNCFGATPNGTKCAKSICALNPGPGGC